jgi:L-2-hydroxyglutarate oxidase LhgO
MTSTSDFLVIGGGVIGVSVALQLRKTFPDLSVHVLDKEAEPAAHASGRNSGVLHAGFYYTAESLKAKFTREGNEYITRYCDERKLPINKCGKLVVTQSDEDLPQLDELFRRGKANGSKISEVTAAEARELEPRAKTIDRALWSPHTSSVDPIVVMKSFIQDAMDAGVQFHWNEAYVKREKDGKIRTTRTVREAGFVVNAAGLYADKVAHDFGFSKRYRIMPFKGLYLYSSEPKGSFKRHIYPVPNLKNPFLGVHFTLTVGGDSKIGPTAIPAFWREQYHGLDNFQINEFLELSFRQLGLALFSQFDFKKLALEEIKKYSRSHLVHLASRLAKDVDLKNFRKWGRAGIRAQLYDIENRKLEMDFVIENDSRSLHVLNAISPAFTCSVPFAEMLVEKIKRSI